MVFRSKVDAFYIGFILIVILIIGLVSFLPLLLEDVPFLAILICASIFLLVASPILWMTFSVEYVFLDDYLLIKGGPFRNRIPYKSITRITSTDKVLSGHRILSSRDALEIFNQYTFFGSIKISPQYKKDFLGEIKKRCPGVMFED